MYDENAFGSCYALNSLGELYCWGGNILTPEKVTLFSNIREVKSIGDLYIQCESGEKYIIIPRFNLHHDDTVYSYNSLPDGAELFGYGSDGYLMYTNNQLTYIDVDGLHQYGSGESFDEILALEDKIKNLLPLDITEKIENIIPCSYQGFGGATLITDTGSVIGVGYDEGDIVIEYRGGQGIKKASLNYTDFLLFNNGELCASGDNEAGQLGDGTMTDYFDGYLTIDEADFSDFEYNYSRKRCIALDEDYNVWGWGEGFGVSPEIIVENTDFLREG